MSDAARPAPSLLQRVNGAVRLVPTWLIYLICLMPGISTVILGFTDNLGANPARTMEHTLGLWALRLLIAGLAITPLRRWVGLNLMRFRRVIGLAAFTYVVAHLLTYMVLDVDLNWSIILRDLVRRWYIIIGMVAFVLLIPLAVTSTNAMIRRMGPVAWNRLHKLVYVAAILGALHFLMSVKSWPPEPMIYLGLVVFLVALRFIPERRRRRAA